MSDLRQAAQQVLDAWQTSLYGKPSHQKAVVLAMTNLNIVLQQQAEPVAQRSDGMPISKMERELRRMLCIERHGRSAYMDDGEASFCGDKYCRSIDYMRESVESIKQAWYDAGVKKLAGAQPEQQAEPCQYCGLSECDPKCMWIEQAPQQQAEPVAWEHHAKKLTHWLHCMSYHDSYFGEPAGLVKQVTAELNRLIGTALRSALEQPERQAEPVHGDIRALKYRIHELEGEVMGYKRMLDVAEATSQPQQQAEPVATHRITAWGHCGVCRHDRIPGEGCARQECPDSPQRKPLTGEQDRALCEAYCNDASDEYFKARPAMDFPEMRRIFYAGHRKAWINYETAHGIKEPKS